MIHIKLGGKLTPAAHKIIEAILVAGLHNTPGFDVDNISIEEEAGSNTDKIETYKLHEICHNPHLCMVVAQVKGLKSITLRTWTNGHPAELVVKDLAFTQKETVFPISHCKDAAKFYNDIQDI